MNIKDGGGRLNLRDLLKFLLMVVAIGLAGCAALSPGKGKPSYDEPGPLPPLAYYQFLSRLSAAELSRERMVLAALPQNPNTHLRTAMLFGHPRGPLDLGKATQQLELVLKSNDPAAVSLQPLARLLADNYAERQKAEGQLDRQGQQLKDSQQQLKDSQRKALELQEKLDGLADIERTLPIRPAQRPVGARSLK